ncbi:unnamed protein product [Schistosoma margrebowiei]|uniref:Uncharacterized protein n=1 Tax=Schistosoma margrebowiei TaxID=48269 RepID=A0A183MQY6_9TREM|nr:unnamed protein product [Schistosoma margrebowiei]
MPLVDSESNVLTSSISRCYSIDNLMSESGSIYLQLRDMGSKLELHVGSSSILDELKQEVKALLDIKLLLSKDVVPGDLEDETPSFIDFTARGVRERIILRNNVIINNIFY